MPEKVSLTDQIGKYSINSDISEALAELSVNNAAKDNEVPKINESNTSQDYVNKLLTEEEQKNLYSGCDDYSSKHEGKIKASGNKEDDPNHFRKKFVQLIEEIVNNDKKYSGTDDARKKNPKSATITVSAFLTPEGQKLYQDALEEEMNSKEYRAAVFLASTNNFSGPKWAEKLVVTVAGPSGCGKSYAAQRAVEEASKTLKTEDPDQTTDDNFVVSVDGGIGREVSQMRKLLIQAANKKGFSGLKDLSKQSEVLDKVKFFVEEAVLKNVALGVVIPDTFSEWLPGFGKRYKDRIRAVDKPGTKQVFCRIVGENQKTFEEVVRFMGDTRAWKTDFAGIENQPLNLNSMKGLKESKAYNGGLYFQAGVNGSKAAENWFKNYSASRNEIINITNDLIFVKKVKVGDKEDWIRTEKKEEADEKISKAVFDKWSRTDKKQDLFAYNKEIPAELKIVSIARKSAGETLLTSLFNPLKKTKVVVSPTTLADDERPSSPKISDENASPEQYILPQEAGPRSKITDERLFPKKLEERISNEQLTSYADNVPEEEIQETVTKSGPPSASKTEFPTENNSSDVSSHTSELALQHNHKFKEILKQMISEGQKKNEGLNTENCKDPVPETSLHSTLLVERNSSERFSESSKNLSFRHESENSEENENRLNLGESLHTNDLPPTENMPNSNVSENKDSIDSILSKIITNIENRSTRWKIVQNLEKVRLLKNIRENLEKYNKENTSQKITDIKSAPQALKDLIRVVCAEHRNLKLFSPEKTQSTQDLEKYLIGDRVPIQSTRKNELLKAAASKYDTFKEILESKSATDSSGLKGQCP